ncbi:MAG: mRNA surveillance protein pelota [Candidatus Diapherotrites archaeon CG11_big_fil_rev_8_21_14_0_20_37_9]|nr:MAG: mRNA surveillance protein pelota [Candidatus Diapherotrites archaeon CG11_big_fil_rev_8_21_14_0_20_37_9]
MKILKIDRKENFFEVMPDSFDDLWHLEKLIEPGDFVSGSSERKIKPKNEGEKAFKQKIYLTIESEKSLFHEATNQLRVQGLVLESKPEDAAELRSHHTIEIETGTTIKVRKKALKNYHVERLEKAKASAGRKKLLLVVMDDEEAELAFLKDAGFERKARIIATKEGKRFVKNEKEKTYFTELLGKIKELNPEKMVIAGPGFEKQNFEKFINEKREKLPVIFESTNSVGLTGLNELVKSGKIDKLVEGFQAAEEAKIVEKLFMKITEGAAAFGIKEVEEAVDAGAVEDLIVEEKFMVENRNEVEPLLDRVEQLNGKNHFIEDKNEAGKKITGIGGIAATLRYKMKY